MQESNGERRDAERLINSLLDQPVVKDGEPCPDGPHSHEMSGKDFKQLLEGFMKVAPEPIPAPLARKILQADALKAADEAGTILRNLRKRKKTSRRFQLELSAALTMHASFLLQIRETYDA